MAMSESRKRANAKWNKANTKNAACTLTLEEQPHLRHTQNNMVKPFLGCCWTISDRVYLQNSRTAMDEAIKILENLS